MTGTPTLDISDHVVAVFGCGPGIGLASAEALGACGAAIACIDINSQIAQNSAEHLRSLGITAKAYACNVLVHAQVAETVDTIRSDFGRLSDAVNVIGRGAAAALPAITAQDFDDQMNINFRHHLIVAQNMLPDLVENAGSYVAISSIYGLTTSPLRAMYGAAKAALGSLIRNLAVEYAGQGARFNAIAPGSVRTPRAAAIGMDSGPAHDKWISLIPIGRMAEPADIANVVLFLVSDLSRYLTGQVLTVDGGITINPPLPDNGLNAPAGTETAAAGR